MSDPGYPDDIRQYDHDPRSPFYDDKGYELFFESRVDELLKDVTELTDVDHDAITEIIFDQWKDGKPANKTAMLNMLDKYFNGLAEKQADKEWEGK